MARQVSMDLLVPLLALLGMVSGAKMPKNWKTCSQSDPKANECLKVAIEGALVDIMKGVPSLGILPMEPLHMDKLELDNGGASGPVAINLVFRHIDFVGFSNIKIRSLDVNWTKGKAKVHLESDQPFHLIGKYSVKGKVLLLPVVGDGNCNFTITRPDVKVTFDGSFHQKKGKTYYHTDKMTVFLDQERVYMDLENLFNGDKQLGETMNRVLNENWLEVYGAFKGTVEAGLGEAFKSISNRVFDKIPFDQLVPP